MKIDVPDHAKFRIMERGIDVDNAKAVVKKPDSKKFVNGGRIEVIGKLSDGRVLTIVYVEKNKNHIVIVTGYYEN